MKKIAIILAAAALALCVSCNKDGGKTDEYAGLSHQTFVETEEAFPNPERGFYFVQSFKSASAYPIVAQSIERQRLQNKTLVYMGYYPKDYMEGDIAPEFLELMRTNMQTLRENGAKCILRFA